MNLTMSNNKQSSVDKEFVSYEQALALKELGFDEPCIAFYNSNYHGKFLDFKIQGGDYCSPYLSTETKGDCPNVPTFSQAFRWFRDKDLNGEVYSQQRPKDNFMYAFRISGTDIIEDGFTSYEEAELACLKKLIEIVKEKNNEQQ